MRNKAFKSVLALVAAACLLTGCGGGAGTHGKSAAQTIGKVLENGMAKADAEKAEAGAGDGLSSDANAGLNDNASSSADSNSDGNTNVNSDSGANEDASANSNAGENADSSANTNVNSSANTSGNENSNADANVNTSSSASSDSDGNTNVNSDSNANEDANANANEDGSGNTDADGSGNSNADGSGNTDANASANTNVDANANASDSSAENGATGTSENSASTIDYTDIDIDLTELSSALVYSEVYNMMCRPDDYIGKTIKMRGSYTYYHEESTGVDYHACIIQDATACCAQGIEFVTTSDFTYPADFPNVGEDVTVTGIFDIYYEGDFAFMTLRDAILG